MVETFWDLRKFTFYAFSGGVSIAAILNVFFNRFYGVLKDLVFGRSSNALFVFDSQVKFVGNFFTNSLCHLDVSIVRKYSIFFGKTHEAFAVIALKFSLI